MLEMGNQILSLKCLIDIYPNNTRAMLYKIR
jgi:predicted nucleotidyltransferase